MSTVSKQFGWDWPRPQLQTVLSCSTCELLPSHFYPEQSTEPQVFPAHHPEMGETSARMMLTMGKVQNQESHWEMEPETWWLPLLCTFQLLEPIYSHYFTGSWKYPNWFKRLPETKSKDWFSSSTALEKRLEIQNPDTFVPVL